MKKLFTFFLALVASMSTAFAYDAEIDGIYYNLNTSFIPPMSFNYTATVTYSDIDNKYSGSVVIPSSVSYNGTTYSVTSIGDEAFRECSSLTSVTIPNSVKSIGEETFRSCSSLTSITIPNSVTSIGVSAFRNCTWLESVTIGNSVTSIGNNAFEGCRSLTSVTIPNSVTSIEWGAFSNCYSLTSITIPNSVTSIGEFAFFYCSSLTSVTIPNSVTSIGYSAFIETGIYNDNANWENDMLYINDCLISAKESISGAYAIKAGTRLIADDAFENCSSLTSVTIPNSVTSIGEFAFFYCSSLTSVTIPNSVTSIGIGAFADCSSLTSVTIGNSVTSIGDGAFCRCSSLASVTIPNSVTEIGEYAFYGCDKLVDVYCYATTPPVTKGEDTFSCYNAFLYVPCESKNAYMVDAVWGNFKYIECISSEGIEDIQSDEVQSTKVVNDGQVLILRNGKTYTMQGQEVK